MPKYLLFLGDRNEYDQKTNEVKRYENAVADHLLTMYPHQYSEAAKPSADASDAAKAKSEASQPAPVSPEVQVSEKKEGK